MILQNFIDQYDKQGSIVLLEGKRKVAKDDQQRLELLGFVLAKLTSKMTFRSGNASGSDQFFCKGVAQVDKSRLEVITPYAGHRKSANLAHKTYALDDINLDPDSELIKQSKQHRNTEKLIDSYVSGNKNRNTIKAAYIIRDTLKALGNGDIKPASFGIFYDDLENPMSGGTGHTMNVCKQNNIPMVNQTHWMSWAEEAI